MSFIPHTVEPKVYHGEIIPPKRHMTPQEQAARTQLIILEMNKILIGKPQLAIHLKEPPSDEIIGTVIDALFVDYRKYMKPL